MEVVDKNTNKETPEEAVARRKAIGFQPRKANILIDVIEINKKMLGSGLSLPDTTDPPRKKEDFYGYYEHPLQGVVVAVGPDCGKIPLGNTGHTSENDVVVGDKIVFRSDFGLSPVIDKGHLYFLLSDHDVIGILEKA